MCRNPSALQALANGLASSTATCTLSLTTPLATLEKRGHSWTADGEIALSEACWQPLQWSGASWRSSISRAAMLLEPPRHCALPSG